VISQFPAARRPRGPARVLARNPTQVAWVAIWLSFLVFTGLLTAGIAAGLHYVATAVQPAAATLTTADGIVLLQEPSWPLPEAVRTGQALHSGDLLSTDAISRAQLRFPDGSTVYVQPGTQVQLTWLRVNRYQWLSAARRYIDLDLRTGRLEAQVPRYPTDDSRFRVTAFGTQVTIPEGTTDVWLSEPRSDVASDPSTTTPFTNSCCATQVLTQTGEAVVQGSGSAPLLLHGNQRTIVPMGGVPAGALAPTWNLLFNPTFSSISDGIPDGWLAPRFDPDPQHVHVAVVSGATPFLHLWSSGSNGQGPRGVYFRQEIDRDVQNFLEVDLIVSFRIHAQSLPGGGMAGTEYPFKVAVDYVPRSDPKGDTTWFQGYYITPGSGQFVVSAEAAQVATGQWFTPSPNGEGTLRLSALPDPPIKINWVEFSASGWDFDTDVREVRLVAR
jgi:hypothetical protein